MSCIVSFPIIYIFHLPFFVSNIILVGKHKYNSLFFFFAAINGYVFESGQLLGLCNGETTSWHLSSVGAQDYIQSATFYGHTFNLNDRTEDILGLYPMTGETIFMNMDNIGQLWLATIL